MLNQPLIIARKELKDSLRDTRSLVSSLFYSLMGPAIVLLVRASKPGANEVLTAMASIFVMVSAFSGGMNVAMDTVAGERERRSLLPLLLNPVVRTDVVIGKWLAVAAFSCAGLIINLTAFSIVLSAPAMLLRLPMLLPLALLAAALEILISTWCRSIKEAHTYLSFLIFLPMVAGIFAVFVPRAFAHWGWLVPILGQQMVLAGQMTTWQTGVLFGATVVGAAVALFAAGNRLERDDVVYGS
jgi:sodium transport system permease protein